MENQTQDLSDTLPESPPQIQQDTFSAKEIAGSFGIILAIVGVIIAIDPRSIPMFFDLFKIISVLALGLLLIVSIGHSKRGFRYKIFGPLQKTADLFERDRPSHLILTSGILFVILMTALLEKPTERQLAQQILDARGMRFTAEFYQTAMEVGNQNAIRLFHEAGFHPSLAYTRLARPGETNENRLAVDLLLDNDYDTLRNILMEIGKEPEPTDYGLWARVGRLSSRMMLNPAMAASEQQESILVATGSVYDLLDTPLELAKEDEPVTTGSDSLGPPANKTEASPNQKFTILDRAISNNHIQPAVALLSLGANYTRDLKKLETWMINSETARILSVDPALLLRRAGLDANRSLQAMISARFNDIYPTTVQADSAPVTDIDPASPDDATDSGEPEEIVLFSQRANRQELLDDLQEGNCTDSRIFRGYINGINGYTALMDLDPCNTINNVIEGLITLGNYQIPFYYKRLNYDLENEEESPPSGPRSRFGTLLLADLENHLTLQKVSASSFEFPTLRGVLPETGDFIAENEELSLRVRAIERGNSPQLSSMLADSIGQNQEPVTLACDFRQATDIQPDTLYRYQCAEWSAVELLAGQTDMLMRLGQQGGQSAHSIVFSQERMRLNPEEQPLLRLVRAENGDSSFRLQAHQTLPALSADAQEARTLNLPAGGPDFSAHISAQRFYADFNLLYMGIRTEAPRRLSIRVDGISSDVDVYLINQITGDTVAESTTGGTSAENINQLLPPGDYSLQLRNYGRAETTFNLAVDATQPRVLDLAPESLVNSCAQDRGRRTSDGTLTRLSLEEARRLSIELASASDIDLQLIRGDGGGEVSRTSADSTERIEDIQLDAGEHFIRAYFGEGDYTLTVCDLEVESN